MGDETYLVRSGTISGFDDLVRDLGADPEYLYRNVGLTASLFENSDYMVPYINICTLMDTAAKELEQQDFGLLLANRRKEFPIGVLWSLMVQCPNVEAALRVVTEHFHLHSQGVSWSLDIEGDYAFVTRVDRIAGQIPTFQYAVLSMCDAFKALKVLCGQAWHPSAVSFTHSPPEHIRKYNHFFGLKVEFNQEFTRFVFPVSDLDKEITGHDRELYNHLNRQVQEMETQYESKEVFYSKVKLLIQQCIHSEKCTQSTIAQLLSMHPKKLQRELNHHGVTFRELRAEVRLDMAERYLKDSDIPLTIIAEILGFSELSGFSHAFKTRHEVSPAVWRTRANGGEA